MARRVEPRARRGDPGDISSGGEQRLQRGPLHPGRSPALSFTRTTARRFATDDDAHALEPGACRGPGLRWPYEAEAADHEPVKVFTFKFVKNDPTLVPFYAVTN